MKILNNRYTVGLIAVTFLVIAGCGGSGSGSGEKTGRISLSVSDGPIHEAEKVCIAFSEIEFHSGAVSFVEDLGPVVVNLLEFQGMNAAPLLFDLELPAGEYQWMRLGVNAEFGGLGGQGVTDPELAECQGEESYIEMTDGAVYNLYVPSSALNGLKLVGGFTVPVNGSADFTAEFDLMKSVTMPSGLQPDVVLRPTIRLVNNVEVGTLTGEVSSGLATGSILELLTCVPSVYVFDDGVTPNAIDMEVVDEMDPIATAMVNEQTDLEGQVSYHYTVGYLLPGDYEVTFTCDGTTFQPADGKAAEIFVQELTEVDFP